MINCSKLGQFMHPNKLPASTQKAQRKKAILKQETIATDPNSSAINASEFFSTNEQRQSLNSAAPVDRDLYPSAPTPWEKYSFYVAAGTAAIALVWFFASQYFAVLGLQDDTKLLKTKSDNFDKFQIVTESHLNQLDKLLLTLDQQKARTSNAAK